MACSGGNERALPDRLGEPAPELRVAVHLDREAVQRGEGASVGDAQAGRGHHQAAIGRALAVGRQLLEVQLLDADGHTVIAELDEDARVTLLGQMRGEDERLSAGVLVEQRPQLSFVSDVLQQTHQRPESAHGRANLFASGFGQDELGAALDGAPQFGGLGHGQKGTIWFRM